MNHPWAEVNAAVLAVLMEWRRPLGRGPARSGHHQPEVFGDRLLGVRQAEGLADRGEVRILAGTVVTPLARDLLKRRGVAVRVVSGREANQARTQRQGEWGFAIGSTRSPGLVAALRRQWLDGAWSEVANDARGAAHWVVESANRGALVVADEASVATWRASRVEGVRAATVSDIDATARAVRHLGANLLVVEPLARSIHLIRQIGERFRAAGAPVAPGWDQADVSETPR